MMDAAAAEIRILHAASVLEAAALDYGHRARRAEALQIAMWRHRDAIAAMATAWAGERERMRQIAERLRPFARVADVLTDENPVLVSLPSMDGRSHVQLRPADFRNAARIYEAHL